MSDSEARGALKPEHVLRRDISLEDDSSAQGYALLELLAMLFSSSHRQRVVACDTLRAVLASAADVPVAVAGVG